MTDLARQSTDLRKLAGGFSLPEVPRWHDGRLWIADMFGGQVLALDPDGSLATRVDVPGDPVGLAWTGEDQLLVLTREGRLLERDHAGRLRTVRQPEAVVPQVPFNELTVHRSGRMFTGRFGLREGALVRIEHDGSVSTAANGLLLPNGHALTPDGETLIVAESAGQRLTAFTVTTNGELRSRRVWASFGEPPRGRTLPEVLAQVSVWPDGIALDASGAAWVANPIGREVIRVLEGGEVKERLSTGP